MNITVAKFGGTSMGSADAITQVAQILQKNAGKTTQVAVVSAMSKVTDQLLFLGSLAVDGEPYTAEFDALVAKHNDTIEKLGISVSLNEYFDELRELLSGVAALRELSPASKDHLVSFGERMSSVLLAAVLNKNGVSSKRIDTKQLVMTDNNYVEANVDFVKTKRLIRERIMPLLEKNILPVLTGFLGQSEEGRYSTLGRGGSDYSGAIVAAAIAAHKLEIWTDVDGIFSSDPRIIPEARVIPKVSFDEAAELAYFGAKVLHPKTIQPAIKNGIPVYVLNTFNPSAPGTVITDEESHDLKSVTWRKGITIINVCSTRMLDAHGFLAKIFDLFAKHGVVVDVVATSEVSVSMTVAASPPAGLIDELSEFSRVTVEPGFAIICLVGGGIRDMSGILGKMFGAICDHSVKMVSQGASKRNITFLIEEKELPAVSRKVFDTFFA